MPEFEKRIHQWFLKRTRGSESGRVLTKGVMSKLCAEVVNDPIAIRKGLMMLRDDGGLEFISNDRGEPISSYITVIKPRQEVPEHVTRWTTILGESELSDVETDAIKPIAEALVNFSENDMRSLFNGMKRLRNDQKTLHGQPAYLISARYLLGSSKLLAGLPSRALKAFGIDPGCFPKHPFYVVVGGATNPVATVLVENPAAFELALKTTAAQHCAFISTYGFGLDKASDEYGKQLAGIVEDGFEHAVTLVREGGSCPPTKQLLTAKNLYFWGDLDMAGMQIFERIAAKVPHVQLSALYGPMIEAIQDPERRHPYAAATGKSGQKLSRSNRQDVQKILFYCEHHAVDQEIVLPGDIELLADKALDVSALEKVVPST